MNKLEKNENYNNKTFEDIKHIDENGIEFWYARELMPILQYSKWQNFEKILDKAKISCENSDISVFEHFTDVSKLSKRANNADVMIKDYKLKQDEIAEKVSKSRATITNSLRLLKLDKRVQEMVMEGKLSNGHARTIISVEDKDKQFMIAQKIFDENLSVREVEKLMRELEKPNKVLKKTENDFVYRDFEENMSKLLATHVTIKNKDNNKGKIEISYYSQEELERIYDLLKKLD